MHRSMVEDLNFDQLVVTFANKHPRRMALPRSVTVCVRCFFMSVTCAVIINFGVCLWVGQLVGRPTTRYRLRKTAGIGSGQHGIRGLLTITIFYPQTASETISEGLNPKRFLGGHAPRPP